MSDRTLAAPPSPYKGLAPFGDSDLDTLLFFGREREAAVVRANLVAARLTILYGPSGVGKTSLLRAGVAHALRQEEGAAVVLFPAWSGDPASGLVAAVEEEVTRVRPDARVASRPERLPDAVAAWTAALGADLYVVLDQFEEYFLYHDSNGPFSELAEVVRQRGVRANFLISIREDALAQLDAFKAQIPNLFGNALRLDRLDREAATRAILGPLQRFNELSPDADPAEAEPELVEEILDSVTAGRIQLGASGRGGADEGAAAGLIETPYLQLVLERLWEVETGRGSRRLRLATLRELGGATRIVEDHLEQAMAALSPAEKDAAAAMYNHLVTPSGTKIAHRARDLARYAAVDETDAARVLERLARERILRAGENGAVGPQYEIFHDVLADAVLTWRTRHEAERRLEDERAAAARRQRRLVAMAAASLVAAALLAGVALYALTQRSAARESEREARAGELVALAAASLQTDPERSLELALDASEITRSRSVENVLRKALKELRATAVVPISGADGDSTLGPDGRAVAVLDGNAVRIQDPSGRTPPEALRHANATAVAFSADGSLVATTGRDGFARVWRRGDAQLMRAIRHPGAVAFASFSRDGTKLVTAAQNRVVRLFEIRSGKQRLKIVQPSLVMAARLSPTGDLLATGGSDDVARIWDAKTGRLRLTLTGHEGRVGDVAFSPDGQLLATGSTDSTARVWKTNGDGDLVAILPGHENYVSRVEFSPDGELIATASRDRRARIFDAQGATLRATLPGHREPVTDLAFSRNGAELSTVSSDGTVRLWDALALPELKLVRTYGGPIRSVRFSRDGRRIVGAAQGADLSRLRTNRELVEAVDRVGSTTAVAFSDDGDRAVSGHARGDVRLWDAETGKPIRELPAHRAAVTSATFSPDGRFVVTTSEDHNARLSDAATGKQVWLLSHTALVSDADFSADGRWVAIAGPGYAGVVDARTGERVLLLNGKDRVLTAAAFSPTGWRIATGGESGAVRTYDCRLCGGIDELVRLGRQRLARLQTPR